MQLPVEVPVGLPLLHLPALGKRKQSSSFAQFCAVPAVLRSSRAVPAVSIEPHGPYSKVHRLLRISPSRGLGHDRVK
eukprot:690607-Prymnesium_polylepis.1